MSDAAEKPFEPTPHRIAKARREGNVARASELPANLAFAAAGAATVAIAPFFGALAAQAIVAGARPPSARSALVVAVALVPVAAAALAGAGGSALQTGGFAFAPVNVKFERLNPVEGIKRIVSRETAAHSFRAGLAFACASVAMLPLLARSLTAAIGAQDIYQIAAAAWLAAREIGAVAGTVGLCFALAEFAAARKSWLGRLRMSFAERKREAKEEEGDAAARGRRRSLHRALLRGGMRRLKEASFVVANPQHVAVALEYRPPEVAVPRVLVRAADEAALRVRTEAARYRIPIVENVPLARALYGETHAGDIIPTAHYVAVAEVVAALLRAGALS